MAVRTLLTAFMVVVAQALTVLVLKTASATEGYTTVYSPQHRPTIIYKSVDSGGKISYSVRPPGDTVSTEKITLKPDPSADYIENNRQRREKISETAALLAEARQKRQADREAEEKKRLERLALLRSARPRVTEHKVYVGWNPLWRSYPHPHYHRYPGQSPSHRPHPHGRTHARTFNGSRAAGSR
jgi:hypothetical protein